MKELIITYLPALVLGFIWVFCTFSYIKGFKDEANKIKESSSYQKLEDQMKCLFSENYDLKKDNKELKKQLEDLMKTFKELADNYELKLEEKNKEE